MKSAFNKFEEFITGGKNDEKAYKKLTELCEARFTKYETDAKVAMGMVKATTKKPKAKGAKGT